MRSSPTESGLQTLALLGGLIVGAIGSGAMVSRTGKYKALIVGALVFMVVGQYLLTGLTATTDLPYLWVWMFITGLGIGPTFSVLTIVIQSVVPFERLGVATSNLTFFRQIGGSVGLAIAGTLFASTFSSQLVPQLTAAGVPAQVATQMGGAAGAGQFSQVGGNVRKAVAAGLPSDVQPLLDQIVAGIYQAFSLAVASTFWLGVIAGILALVTVAVALPAVTLRGMGSDESTAVAFAE